MVSNRKQLLWKIVQSWWILLSFIMFLNWSAFFYIAMRVKSKRFAILGLIYAVLCFGGIIMLTSSEEGSWQLNVGFSIYIFGWVISIFHAFIVRKEFLLRLEGRQLSSGREVDVLKRRIESEYGVNFDESEILQGSHPAPPTVRSRAEVIRKKSDLTPPNN
jgi:hypothetical protein